MSHGDESMPREGAILGSRAELSGGPGEAPRDMMGDDEDSLDEWVAAQQVAAPPPSEAATTATTHTADHVASSAGAGRDRRHPSTASRLRRVGRVLTERAWMIVAAGAAITLVATMDFRPPTKVRTQGRDDAQLVGDASSQESDVQANPQAVVVRAELSRYEASASELGARPPEGGEDDPDARRVVLARPIVTTLYGLTATFEQTLRLQGGRHEVDVSVEVTPRVGEARRGELPPIRLERDVRVVSRRQHGWLPWDRAPVEQLVMHEHVTLADATQGTSRLTFAVDDQLFVLSIDVDRPSA